MSSEASRATSAELSLNTKVDFVISNTDPAAIDSLTEIVGAFQSADGDLNGAITSLATAATLAVDNEASIRLAADQSIAGELSSEIADREAAISTEEVARISGDASVALNLSSEVAARISDVNAEETRAMSVEAVLSSDLSTEVANRVAAVSAEESRAIVAEGSLATALNNEVSARIADVDAEESRAIVAEGSIASNLSTEIVDRTAAVSAEASARVAGDASLASDLSTETARAITAEGSLTTAISVEQSRIDVILDGSTVDLDQFSEIVSFVNGIDLENDNALLSAVTSIGLDINNLESADMDLSNDIQSVETFISSEVVDLTAYIDSQDLSIESALSSDIENAVNAEAALRISADASIDTAIASVDSAVTASVASIEGSISEISTEISDIYDELTLAIENEATLREAADASLEVVLSTEVSYLIANTDLGSIDSFAEVVADLSSEVLRAESVEASLLHTYYQKLTLIGDVDGTNAQFSFNNLIMPDSESIYLNGLLMTVGDDYTTNGTSVTFNNAPQVGDKVKGYAVQGPSVPMPA